MAFGLLVVLALSCCVAGHALAVNNYTAWALVPLTMTVWIALLVSYAVTSLAMFYGSG